MSLLNNVLRDLQTRGAFGVEPLTGLEPVAEAPTQHRWTALLLPALAVLSMASATVLWQPASDGRWLASFARIMVGADMHSQSGLQTAAKTSPQAEPDLTASGDPSRGVFPDNKTSESSPALLDDDVVDTAADAPPAKSPSASADSPPAVLADQYVVQLGAFVDPANAASLLKFLQQNGFPILTRSTIDAEGGTLTRMLAGPYANRAAALSAKEALEADGWLGYVRIKVDTDTPAEPDLTASGDHSRAVLPIDKTNQSSPAPLDDDVVNTMADAPATATISRRDTGDAATAAARFVTRGLIAMRGNDLQTAERLFREALTIDPGDGATWSYLYSVLVRASKPAAAEQALRRGLISARQPAPLAKLYARMLLDRGETDAAVSILRTHRPLPASDIEYDAFLAALLQQLGQYTEAGDIYRQLLTVEPGTGSWWIGLAMSYESLGNRPDALSAFERALRAESLKIPLTRYARRRIAELQAHD